MTDTTSNPGGSADPDSRPVPAFELENVGAGPDPFSLTEAATDPATDAIVLLFQRDYHCGNCRKQVQAVADRYEAFRNSRAQVVSIVPEPADRVAKWQAQYELPFPLLADPSAEVSDAYDQPVRFGVLGSLHDLVGRMPLALDLDVRDGTPTVAVAHEGKLPADRPSVDDLLADVRSIADLTGNL